VGRKKMVPPAPVRTNTIEVEGELVVIEEMDCDSWAVGPGAAQRNAFSERLARIEAWIVDQVFAKNGRINKAKFQKILKNAETFRRALDLAGMLPEDFDQSSIRERYYPYIMRQVQIWDAAVASNSGQASANVPKAKSK
jgi:hypothetical protein